MDTGAEGNLGFCNLFQDIIQVPPKCLPRIGTAIRQTRFGLRPYPLIRIQFRGISRKRLQAQPGIFSEQLSEVGSFMDRSIIPDGNHRSAQMFQEVSEEMADIFLGQIFPRDIEIKPQPFPQGADREAGDEGEAIMQMMMALNGSLAPQGPGLPNRRDQEESRFVNKDQVGAQVFGVFFIRGNSSFFHRAISVSSLSKARFWGFCQLKPRDFRSRPMWSRWYCTQKTLPITSAIRAVVQRSVRYPLFKAPARRIFTSRRFCFVLSLAGRPGTGRGLSPSSPSSSRVSRQRWTEIGAQCNRRPTSFRDNPSSKSDIAFRRRFSNNRALPYGRIRASSFPGCSYYNITLADVNKPNRNAQRKAGNKLRY